MTTPNGAIVFHATSGSDTQASGLGPSTAVYGSGASTDGTAVVTGITTTGVSAGDLLWVQTASGRQFSIIASVDSSTQVTCDDTFALGTGQTWAIGGKRATWDNSDSRQAFADAAGLFWTFETETSQTLTSTISVNDVNVVGTSTGIGDRQLVTTSVANLSLFDNTGGLSSNNNFKNLKFTNSNATKTDGEAFLAVVSSSTYFFNCEFGDATDKLHKGTDRSAGSPSMTFDSCYIHDTVSDGVATAGGGTMTAYDCVSLNCGGSAFVNQNNIMTLINCAVLNFGTTGAVNTSTISVYNCLFHTGSSGLSAKNVGSRNTAYYGLTTGITGTAGTLSYAYIIDNNYFGNVTTNTSLVGQVSTNENALTADPCTDAVNGDATLNETTGGGAALRSAATTLGSTETRPFRWLDTSTGGAAGSSRLVNGGLVD